MPQAMDKQVTSRPRGHILTNTAVWSSDSRWIVYDTRSDREGSVFDARTIERVNVETLQVQRLYESRRGACCGVATCHPRADQVVFIHGPEEPTPEWTYGASRRRGVIADAPPVDAASSPRPDGADPATAKAASSARSDATQPATADAARTPRLQNLDARDLAPPFTPGALRGGTHVHVYSPDGQFVSFTYEDEVLARLEKSPDPPADAELNQRNVGVTVLGRPVQAPKTHARNHDGVGFSVLVTRTVNRPRPGSDEISRACEEGWVGQDGYVRRDGRRQKRALAFQGQVTLGDGRQVCEVFVADLPEDLTVAGDGPLEGTPTRRPAPPRGVVQRRLTDTSRRAHPGIQGVRHWLRSSPDGQWIAFLMLDDEGVVQLWLVSPTDGRLRQLTRNRHHVASAFSWSPDGRHIAHVMNGRVCLSDAATGRTEPLTAPAPPDRAPLPLACVFSPDGRKIAYQRPVETGGRPFNQVFVVRLEG